jgi:hypothetical protein
MPITSDPSQCLGQLGVECQKAVTRLVRSGGSLISVTPKTARHCADRGYRPVREQRLATNFP